MIKKIAIGVLALLVFIPSVSAVTYYAWRYREHATDCTALTDGKARDLCFEVDDENFYKCEPAAGDCSGSEWKLMTEGTTYTAGDALTLTANDFDFDGGATPSGDLAGTWGTPTVTWGNIAEGELTNASVVTADIKADNITSALIADDQINSEHYVDGSIDLAHMSAESVDSDQYVDDSIDEAHVNWGTGANQISMADMPARQQSLSVCKSGCAYSVIQTAIDAISDNATDKRYVVLIYPGTYTENITMEDFVSLCGVGKRSNIIIDGTITFASDAGDNSGIKNLLVQHTTTTTGLDLITSPNSTGQHAIIDCTIKLSNSDAGDVGSLIDDDGGTLKIGNSKLVYDFTGTNAGANTHSIIDLAGTMVYDIFDSDFEFTVADADDVVVGINEAAAGTITESIMRNTIFHMTLSHGTYTGICGALYLHGAGTEKWYQSNHLHLKSSGGGTAYGIFMDTTAEGGEIHTTANQVHVKGFTSNRGLNIATGDFVYSHFDDVEAAQGNTGSGTITAVQSPADGNFKVTGDADIDGTLEGATLTEGGNAVWNATETEIINSDHYVDGSIDAIHLAADVIDETKIADDGIDSEHYNDGSIDLAHMSSVSVDSDNIVEGTIIEGDISGDVAPEDGDFMQYDSTGTNFTWRSASETLSDIGAEGDLSNEAGLYAALSDVTNFLQTSDALAGDDITDGSVDASELADNSVDSGELVDGSIDHVHLGTDVITGAAAVGTFEAGDTFLCMEAGVGVRECDYSNLPAANDNVESMATAGGAGTAPLSDGAAGLVMTDIITEEELNSEAELESQLVGVTNVFTNNDGALNDDDVTAADVGTVSANLDDTDASVEWEDANDLDASGDVANDSHSHTNSTITLASTDLTDTSDLLYETELDDFSELQAQISDKTLVNTADGAAWLGTHDFGGADDLELPNGAAPTVDTAGQVSLDTTDDQLVYYGAAERVISYTQTKCAVIENLEAADDDFGLGMFNDAVTITGIGLHCAGTCTTGADISLEDRAGNAMTHTTPTHSTGTGNTTFQAVTAGNGLVAGEALRFDVDNAVSPETDTYTICYTFTNDRQ